jgi:hypothetical protein
VELIERWKRSGATAAEFPERWGLNPRTLQYWNSQLDHVLAGITNRAYSVKTAERDRALREIGENRAPDRLAAEYA